ncbi:MAG: polysaccharide deacetylase family protein [Johnsonella sp.]|nr:polysaccharide deacetylase family protein [Johnsonella sp.]
MKHTFMKIKKIVGLILCLALLPAFMQIKVLDTSAEVSGFGATYTAYYPGAGWNPWIKDNYVLSRYGAYPTAFKIGLNAQPEGMTGTVLYQVNLSATGWLDWVENGAEAGDVNGSMPLEAIRVKLNGQLEENYDIYTRVYQSGAWTDWVKNGEQAGTEGIGTHIDAIRVAVMPKNAGVPEEIQSNAVDPSRPMIALTFDDGPSAANTNRILNSLEANGGRATFYVVGSSIHGAGADAMRRALSLGCEIGNHSYNHENLVKLSSQGVRDTIGKTSARIQETVGVAPATMRPPYGSYNSSVLNTVGMPAILWSIDTLDWKTKSTSGTVNHVLSNVKDGDIILMHDTYATTAAAAEILIPELIGRGYQLVTVSELAAIRGGMSAGKTYGSFR